MMAPPAIHDGTLYAGVGLSDQHIPGGLVIAADARTAEIRWVFNTIPQRPSDEGYDVARRPGATACGPAAASGRCRRSTRSWAWST